MQKRQSLHWLNGETEKIHLIIPCSGLLNLEVSPSFACSRTEVPWNGRDDAVGREFLQGFQPQHDGKSAFFLFCAAGQSMVKRAPCQHFESRQVLIVKD